MMGRTLLAWIFALVLATMATAGPTEDLREAQKAVTAAALALADSQKDACVEAPPDTIIIPPELPPPTGEGCDAASDCQYLNTKCIVGGYWDGWCCDEPANFQSLGSEGRMTTNANCLHRTPRLDKRSIRLQFDIKLDGSWITNCVTSGQHLGGVWAPSGTGRSKAEWVAKNIRIDFSRQCTDGFDCVIQGYNGLTSTGNINLVMDARLSSTRLAGVFSANTWRTVIVTGTYDPALGKVSGTVEYVGKGTRSFSHTDADAKNFPVWWQWFGWGNVDGPNRTPFGVTFRNVNCSVF